MLIHAPKVAGKKGKKEKNQGKKFPTYKSRRICREYLHFANARKSVWKKLTVTETNVWEKCSATAAALVIYSSLYLVWGHYTCFH